MEARIAVWPALKMPHSFIHLTSASVFCQHFPQSTDAKKISSFESLGAMVSHSRTLLSTNNSSLTEGSSQQSLDRNMDTSNQLSSNNSLQESALNSPAKVNLLNELLSKVKRVASDEHIQFDVNNEKIKVSQKQVMKCGTLDKMVSSDVDGFDIRSKLSINKIENCISADLELETISSSVDKDSLNSKVSCCKIKNVKFNCVESEPLSSSVDAVDLIHYTEINMTSLEKNDQSFITDIEDLASSAIANDFIFQNELGQDETPYGAQFNRNSFENKLSIAVNDTSIPVQKREIFTQEALTSAFKAQDELKQETSQDIQLINNCFENKLRLAVNDTSISVQKREMSYTSEAITIALGFEDRLKQPETSVITNGFENKLEVTVSETSISAPRKESLSEQTGMEISHSELPADVENSEAGMSDMGLKSNCDGSTSSSVPNLIKRQKHGLVKSLRQRQFINSKMPADIMENEQIFSDQVSSTIDAQQFQAASVDEPHWDRQQLNQHGMRNIFFDQQQNYLISATRSEQVNSLYSSSFMVMIGLCLTTIFILLNHVHFLVDFSDYF